MCLIPVNSITKVHCTGVLKNMRIYILSSCLNPTVYKWKSDFEQKKLLSNQNLELTAHKNMLV